MDVKIDYLSFTIPLNAAGWGHNQQVYDEIAFWLGQHTNGLGGVFLPAWKWEAGKGRGHYGASLYCHETHAVIWWGGVANHVLFELGGVACDALRQKGWFDQVLQNTYTRATRIDVACDVIYAGEISDFSESSSNARMKVNGRFREKSGDTDYVLSPKSDRYCRVYRYNAPHPRAGVMRIEYVHRADWAKKIARSVVENGLLATADALGAAYAWTHPLWKEARKPAPKLMLTRAETHGAGTVIWVEQSVKPALLRAHKEGLINLWDLYLWIQGELDDETPPF